MDALKEKKKEALIKINEWCKNLIGDSDLYLKLSSKLYCNNRAYTIHVYKEGISAIGDGRFSPFLRAREGEDSLFGTKVGTEIVLHWKTIKGDILREKEKEENNQKKIMEFEV